MLKPKKDMNRLQQIQRVLREMLVIALVIGAVFYATGRNLTGAAGILTCLLTGLMFSPLGWGVYRLARFIIIPRRDQEA